MYQKFFKRLFDFLLSLIALIVMSPVFLVLIVLGAIKMKGNPFFMQLRPGKGEKIFKLIKFRSMTFEKDSSGKLLPADCRLTKYGRILRSTSLDEIPQLINILKGDMSLVGPRPLLVDYLPFYSEEEHLRHNVRPGLTGWSQINGRNALSWDDKFRLDVEYTQKISLGLDLKILLMTVFKVLKRSDIIQGDQQIASLYVTRAGIAGRNSEPVDASCNSKKDV